MKAKHEPSIQGYIDDELMYAKKAEEDLDHIELELAKSRSFILGAAKKSSQVCIDG